MTAAERPAVRSSVALCAAICILAAAGGSPGCSSTGIPTMRESQTRIDSLLPRLAAAERAVAPVSRTLPGGYSIISRLKAGAVNRLLKVLADARSDDLRITFPPTRPLVKDDRNVLGIRYTNVLDIDTGTVMMNLLALTFDRFDGNRIDATIEIAGTGSLRVSGRYTGIPASASPGVELRLRERVAFDIAAADSGTILLRPRPKTLVLRTTFFVTLLEWRIPWSQDIPLQFTDLVKPIAIPAGVRSDVPFPLPASTYGQQSVQFVPVALELTGARVYATGDALELRANARFVPKTPDGR